MSVPELLCDPPAPHWLESSPRRPSLSRRAIPPSVVMDDDEFFVAGGGAAAAIT